MVIGFLLKKMLRDIKAMFQQFIAILLMAFIAMLIYSGMEGTWYGMQEGLEQYCEETNIADAWILGSVFSIEEINQFKEIEGISSVEGRMNIVFPLDEEGENKSIELNVFSSLNISKPIIVEGKEINEELEGIWLDKEYAEKNNLSIGDKFVFYFGNEKIESEILGLVLNSEYTYYLGSNDEVLPDYTKYAYGYINENTFQKLTGSKYTVNKIYIEYESGADAELIKEKISDKFVDIGMMYVEQEQHESIKGVNNKIQQLYKISLMFSAIFILLAILTIVTTMKRIINIQKIQIGALKGLGIKSSTIIIHYACYGVLVSSLGVIAGIVIGPRFLTPILLSAQLKTYSIPLVNSQITYMSILIGLGIIFSCTLASVLACLAEMKGVPAENMRNNNVQEVNFRQNGLLEKMDFESRWILREIFNNKIRFVMGIVGVAGCMVLIIATRGLQDSANFANDYLYGEVYTYERKINISNEFDNNFAGGDTYQYIQEGQIEIINHNKEEIGTVIVVGDGNFINLKNSDGEAIDIENNEGIISHKFAEMLDIEKGDIIELKSYLKRDVIMLKITEISNIPSPQGIIMSEMTWKSLGMDFAPTAILSSDSSEDFSKEISGVEGIIEKSEQSQSVENLLDTFKMIFLLLNIAAITMGGVILYNLGTLSYTEKSREYATLKVLGYRPNEIVMLSIRESVLTTFIGILVAIPLGFKFLQIYVNVVSVETFEWIFRLEKESFMLALIVTVVCSLGINVIVAKKINKINMVDSLKSVE